LQLRRYHTLRRDTIHEAWSSDLERVRAAEAPPAPAAQQSNTPAAQKLRMYIVTVAAPDRAFPRADEAARVAGPKFRAEAPLVRAALVLQRLNHETDDATWLKIAALHADRAKLDSGSRRLIAAQNPTAATAGELAVTKRVVESPLVKMFRQLESSIALDTVRNEYLLHRQIHEWYIAGEAQGDVAQLNERVYAELFLTPSSDPWLGLVTPDTYTALENDGVE